MFANFWVKSWLLLVHYLQNQSACSPSRSCLHLHLLSFMGAPQIDVEWQTDLKWNTNRRAALFLKTNCGLCQCEWDLVSCFQGPTIRPKNSRWYQFKNSRNCDTAAATMAASAVSRTKTCALGFPWLTAVCQELHNNGLSRAPISPWQTAVCHR